MDSKKKKNLFYIDQNMLQYSFENVIEVQRLDNICYVYSDEHFNEILRWENEGFFKILRELRAQKITVVLDNHFNITDSFKIMDYDDPYDLYLQYKETISGKFSNANIFMPMQSLLAGNKSKSIDSIVDDINFQMTEALIFDGSENVPEHLMNEMKTKKDQMIEELRNVLRAQYKNIPNIEILRNLFSKKSLSKVIKDEVHVIDQIWEVIKPKIGDMDKDTFFGKKNIKNKKEPLFLQVVQCHTILNFLGYWPDKGIAKESTLPGINSDASHIAHSMFCDGILTGDKRLAKKAAAIYEYLGIGTKIIYYKDNDQHNKDLN